jgi:hypothetical protein
MSLPVWNRIRKFSEFKQDKFDTKNLSGREVSQQKRVPSSPSLRTIKIAHAAGISTTFNRMWNGSLPQSTFR